MLGLRRPLSSRSGRWSPEDNLPLVESKFARILELVERREVLDVGCVGGDAGGDIEATSHARLAKAAGFCLGIDIVPDEIERRRKEGYNAVVADAQTFDLGRTFDVIVAADLIEHLANPGAFLARAREHLKPGGLLAIVTPNALSLNNALKSLAGLRVRVNPEHTCWYDRTTLRQLLARFGFAPVEEYWQDYQEHPLTALVLRFRKNLAAHFIVIARPRGMMT